MVAIATGLAPEGVHTKSKWNMAERRLLKAHSSYQWDAQVHQFISQRLPWAMQDFHFMQNYIASFKHLSTFICFMETLRWRSVMYS